jgi:hypothetical protein
MKYFTLNMVIQFFLGFVVAAISGNKWYLFLYPILSLIIWLILGLGRYLSDRRKSFE